MSDPWLADCVLTGRAAMFALWQGMLVNWCARQGLPVPGRN